MRFWRADRRGERPASAPPRARRHQDRAGESRAKRSYAADGLREHRRAQPFAVRRISRRGRGRGDPHRHERRHRTITGVNSVHGVVAVPSLHRVFASATGSDQVATIDEGDLKVVSRAPGGDYPDGIAYDASEHAIFVSDEHGGTVTEIDTKTGARIRTIDVGGEAGNTQYDQRSRRVFTDVQARDDVAVIDPVSGHVVARHQLAGCEHDHGLLLDATHRLAFVACDGNARLLAMGLDDWTELGTFAVGEGPDVLAIDPGLGRLYVASESGVVSVFQEEGHALKAIGSAFLANEAHTVAVDPVTHRVYFALENVNGN